MSEVGLGCPYGGAALAQALRREGAMVCHGAKRDQSAWGTEMGSKIVETGEEGRV